MLFIDVFQSHSKTAVNFCSFEHISCTNYIIRSETIRRDRRHRPPPPPLLLCLATLDRTYIKIVAEEYIMSNARNKTIGSIEMMSRCILYRLDCASLKMYFGIFFISGISARESAGY